MTALGLLLLLVLALMLATVPRKWAPAAIVIAGLSFTIYDGIEAMGLNFPALRVLILIGLARVLLRREHIRGRLNATDWLVLAWSGWLLLASLFHGEPVSTLVNRIGILFNATGAYILFRVFLRSIEDVWRVVRLLAWVLVPVALLMLYESRTGHNLFSVLGRGDEFAVLRGDRFRASGPFAHPILAGTMAAVSLPLCLALWRLRPANGVFGMASCVAIIAFSASTGPVLSALAALAGMALWWRRQLAPKLAWGAVAAYVALDLWMRAPAYYVLARIDITGSSTSWHRAELIDAAIRHLSEWWIVGTDVTRHWMPYGVPWSSGHADITNHYIMMGIHGGLPLLLLFVATLASGMARAYRSTQVALRLGRRRDALLCWALFASLLSHGVSFISISYFDQLVLFLYMALAAVSARQRQRAPQPSWRPSLPLFVAPPARSPLDAASRLGEVRR